MGTWNWNGPAGEALVLTAPDEELEHYRLLAYLQRVDADYRVRKLYPHLDDLRARLEHLRSLRERSAELARQLPREVIGLDLRAGELVRAKVPADGVLRAVDAVLSFTLPELEQALGRARDLREELSGRIHCAPVGVLPLSTREGYLLLRQGSEALVYSYAFPFLRDADEELRLHSIRTHYLTTYAVGLSSTYEHIKAELVRSTWSLPNPATFVFESDISLPRIETFMPLAKQLVYELIGHQAA